MSINELWINTYKDDGSERVENFWTRLQKTIQTNNFWADEIKLLKNEPEKRLILAHQNLPLPAAFREAAIALRALIKNDIKKNNISTDEKLFALYHLAVIYSFTIPYSNKLDQPGHNVMEFAPGGLIASLPFEYKQVGHEKLELLTKTDVKMIVEKWGEPNNHTTLHQLHKNVWDYYEGILIQKKKEEDQKSIDEWAELGVHINKNHQQNTPKKWWKFW